MGICFEVVVGRFGRGGEPNVAVLVCGLREPGITVGGGRGGLTGDGLGRAIIVAGKGDGDEEDESLSLLEAPCPVCPL